MEGTPGDSSKAPKEDMERNLQNGSGGGPTNGSRLVAAGTESNSEDPQSLRRMVVGGQTRWNSAGGAAQTQTSSSQASIASRRRDMPPRSAGSLTASTSTPRASTDRSRTHVHTATTRAFYQPLSSQRLQAHRGQRPLSWEHNRNVSEDFDDSKSVTNTNRNSTGSAITTQNNRGQVTQYDLEALPPVTKDTDYDKWAAAAAETPNGLTKNMFERSPEPSEQVFDSTKINGGYPTARKVESTKTSEHDAQVSQEQGSNTTDILSKMKWSSRRSSGTSRANGHTKLASRDGREARDTTPPPRAIQTEKTEQIKHHTGKNYEYFTGNTTFWWGGRLQNAREKPIVLITGTLTVLPCCLFFAYPAPWLWLHISPAIPILFAYVFLLCISSFLHASLSDPGILPRNLHQLPPPEPNDDPLDIGPPTTDWVMVFSSAAQHGAFEVPTKYCKTCNIWRPPRCHHCRVCDNCIDTQDHHCMWLNNCVGRRNYRYFYGFVGSAMLLGIFLFGASIGQVVAYSHHHKISMSDAINQNRVSFAMFIYGLLAFMYPTSLWGYHMFLMARGQTTREYLNSNKFLKKDRHRPFTQKRFWHNWIVVLMRPRPPTYLEFKKEHMEGDQRFGERKDVRAAAEKQQNGGSVEMQKLGTDLPSFQGPSTRTPMDRTPRDIRDASNRG